MASLQADVSQHPQPQPESESQPQPEPQRRQHDLSLAESVAIATRSVHAKLNKLIIARLPLALPPLATDSSAYITGLLHVTPIYVTFEALWRDILESGLPVDLPGEDDETCEQETPPNSAETAFPASDLHELSSCSRMQSILQQLYLPGLMRSDRLKADIVNLAGWSNDTVEEQLRLVEENGPLGEFIQHIKRTVQHRPHALMAYSYILFMALFAGGRFIRATLESAGDDFWDRLPSPVQPNRLSCEERSRPTKRASGLSDEEIPIDDFHCHATHTMPLRFFHFQTPEDGEDLKREFKRRLASMEGQLTAREKQDIVQESICIFDNMTLLVQQLDMVCDAPARKDSGSTTSSLLDLVDQLHPFRSRLRDSVSIARDRIRRSTKLAPSGTKLVWKIWNYSATASPVEPESGIKLPIGHPGLSKDDAAAIELCPAFSKSMRFDKTLPRPMRLPAKTNTAEHELKYYLQVASKKFDSMSLFNWLIILTVGVILLGALCSARRGREVMIIEA
jgi:heme oxygenase